MTPYVFGEWVLDASVALRWVFEDQTRPDTDELLARVSLDDVHVPAVWRLEVANALIRAAREGRLKEHVALEKLNQLMMLQLLVEPAPDWARLIRIAGWALRWGLKVPDSCYLELAMRRGLPLATLDRKLAAAASGLGLAVLPAPA